MEDCALAHERCEGVYRRGRTIISLVAAHLEREAVNAVERHVGPVERVKGFVHRCSNGLSELVHGCLI